MCTESKTAARRNVFVPATTAFLLFTSLSCATLVTSLADETKEAPRSNIQQRFEQLDADKDGRISRTELSSARLLKRMMDGADKDGDGISLEEARAHLGDTNRSNETPADNSTPNSQPSAETSVEVEASFESPRQGPRVLKASEVGVGRMIPDLAFTDINGNAHRLSDASDTRASVIAVTSTSCPVSKRYTASLAKLEGDFADKGVRFIFVNPMQSDTLDSIRADITAHGLKGAYVQDPEETLLSQLDATTTTELFVLDSARTLIYRGAVDDQYGIGYSLDAPRVQFALAALRHVVDGSRLEIAATAAPGCDLDRRGETTVAAQASDLTWHNQVSRIVQAHCLECHRSGGVGPFPLESMDDVIAHAGMIRSQVERGAMPPWFAVESEAPLSPGDAIPTSHSKWINDRSMPAQDKSDLLAWLSGTRAAGNPADSPRPRTFAGEWTIGEPDLIVQLPEPVRIKANGTMPYQFVTAKTTLTEDRWVQGYEIIPTDRSVVHHVIVNVHSRGSGRVFDREEGIGGYWAAYVPGNASQVYPEGFARKLPAGATVSFQIHYTPNGTATQDQLRMGLIFADEPPKYVVETVSMPDRDLNIQPGAADHPESFSRPIPFDLNVMAFMAHMHVRGKTFKYEVTTAGETQTLLDIPRYDFNWQLRYDLAEPIVIPRGSTLKVSATFDNSTGNPANPDPDRTVHWGPQTHEEMLIGYLETFRPLDDEASSADSWENDGFAEHVRSTLRSQLGNGQGVEALFKRLDTDGNGVISDGEFPDERRELLQRLDTDNDGGVTLEEAQAAMKRLRR